MYHKAELQTPHSMMEIQDQADDGILYYAMTQVSTAFRCLEVRHTYSIVALTEHRVNVAD